MQHGSSSSRKKQLPCRKWATRMKLNTRLQCNCLSSILVMYRERTISLSEFRGIVFLTWVVMTMTTMQARWWRWVTTDSGWGSSRRDKNSWGQPKTRLQLTHQTHNLLLHNHNLILAHKVLQLCHFLYYARYQFFWFSFCAQGIGLGSWPEVFCMILNNCSVCVCMREESSCMCVRVRERDREKERERDREKERETESEREST